MNRQRSAYRGIVGWALAIAASFSLPAARAQTSLNDPPGYERLQPGAAWCAPRALFFLARYCGEECSLESVVAACKTDEEGRTTLNGLVNAANNIGLDARALRCTPDELMRVSGPAILALGQPDKDVHFIGLVRRDGLGKARVIDPSINVSPFWVSETRLADRFGGYVVVLRGSTFPAGRAIWKPPLLSAVTVGLGLSLVYCGWRFAKKRSGRA